MKYLSIFILIPLMILISCQTESMDEEIALKPLVTPESHEGLITFQSGEVFYSRNDEWEEAMIGDTILKDDYIKVLESSFCEIQFGNKSVIRIQENTVIKIRDILHSTSDYNIETDIIFGAILCKLEKLSGTEKFNIVSTTLTLGVRGTEFLVQKNSEHTTVAVLTGAVAIIPHDNTQEQVLITEKEQISVNNESGKIGNINTVSSEILKELQKIEQIELINLQKENQTELVKIVLLVEQVNAEIYNNNKLIGIGNYSGVFNHGDAINFIIKKRGYKNTELTIEADRDIKVPYTIDLELSNINDIPSNSQEENQELTEIQNQLLELNNLYNQLKEELDSELAKGITLQNEIQNMRTENQELIESIESKETEIKDLEGELNENEEIVEALRKVLGVE